VSGLDRQLTERVPVTKLEASLNELVALGVEGIEPLPVVQRARKAISECAQWNEVAMQLLEREMSLEPYEAHVEKAQQLLAVPTLEHEVKSQFETIKVCMIAGTHRVVCCAR
jgi:hypothetical protein